MLTIFVIPELHGQGIGRVDEYDTRNWGNGLFATAMDLGLKAGAKL